MNQVRRLEATGSTGRDQNHESTLEVTSISLETDKGVPQENGAMLNYHGMVKVVVRTLRYQWREMIGYYGASFLIRNIGQYAIHRAVMQMTKGNTAITNGKLPGMVDLAIIL